MKSRFFFYLICMVMVFTFSASLIYCRTINLSQAGISFQIPDKWIIEAEKDAYTLKSPDGGSVSLAIAALPISDLDAAIDEAARIISEGIGELTLVSEARTDEVNGMKYVELQATALEGQITVGLALIFTPSKNWLMVTYLGAVEKESIWEKDVAAITASFQPAEHESDSKTNSHVSGLRVIAAMAVRV